MNTEEDEEFERIALRCKETQRVNESKWNSEMCSNYGGFCKKEWVGLTDEEIFEIFGCIGTSNSDINPYVLLNDARKIEAKLKERNT